MLDNKKVRDFLKISSAPPNCITKYVEVARLGGPINKVTLKH